MLIGPVFHAELVRAARRRAAYVVRSCYALILLFMIWTHYAPLAEIDRFRGVYLQDLAGFALATFVSFMAVQIVALLVLIPALCGGVVADEKQRKTFHYLMASQLTSREIIGDKLLARLFAVGVYVLLGVPVMSLLGLFGGVPWEYVAIGYAATLSVTLFAASLSVFVSVLARRVRQGVLIAYLFEVGWLIGPLLVSGFLRFVFPLTYAWLGPVCEYAVCSSPVMPMYQTLSQRLALARGHAALWSQFSTMVSIQVAGSALLLLLSVLLLRPVFRKQEERSHRLNWFEDRSRSRLLARPACGQDAMLWKERHFTRTDVFTKLVVLPATIALSVGLIFTSQLDEVVGAILRDLWLNGGGASLDRGQITRALLFVTTPYAALWLLSVAGASASSITVEREQDTWVSLVSSPLSAGEIVRGKILGAVWGVRGFGAFLILFWLLGVILGGVPVLGFALASLALLVFTSFVAALGVFVSLRARNTSRALAGTLFLLLLFNGGCLALAWPLASLGVPAPTDATLLFSPLVISGALRVPEAISTLEEHWIPTLAQELAYGVLSTLLYGAAAIVLAMRTSSAFDRVTDRPSMRSEPTPERKPARSEPLLVSRTTG